MHTWETLKERRGTNENNSRNQPVNPIGLTEKGDKVANHLREILKR